jgi:hypothetical protein
MLAEMQAFFLCFIELFILADVISIEGNSAFGNLNLIYYANQRNEW